MQFCAKCVCGLHGMQSEAGEGEGASTNYILLVMLGGAQCWHVSATPYTAFDVGEHQTPVQSGPGR